jgi:hypothetical protein
MSRFVLTNIGKHRGWGAGGSGGIAIKNSAGGTIVVQWADGSTFGGDTTEGNEAKEVAGRVINNEPDAA